MNYYLFIFGMLAALGSMKVTGEEEILAKADGKVAAQTLPLDRELSKVKFETATFGLG